MLIGTDKCTYGTRVLGRGFCLTRYYEHNQHIVVVIEDSLDNPGPDSTKGCVLIANLICNDLWLCPETTRWIHEAVVEDQLLLHEISYELRPGNAIPRLAKPVWRPLTIQEAEAIIGESWYQHRLDPLNPN